MPVRFRPSFGSRASPSRSQRMASRQDDVFSVLFADYDSLFKAFILLCRVRCWLDHLFRRMRLIGFSFRLDPPSGLYLVRHACCYIDELVFAGLREGSALCSGLLVLPYAMPSVPASSASVALNVRPTADLSPPLLGSIDGSAAMPPSQ